MKNKQEALRQSPGFVYPSSDLSFPPSHLNFKLSEQEQRVAALVLRGYTYTAIAKVLNIQPNTVKTHQKRIYTKLDINSKRELFALFEKREK